MRVRGGRVSINANRMTQELALAIDQELVLSTPVDTGRARSNWFLTLDSPTTDVDVPYSAGTGGSTAGANAQEAMAQARDAISDRREDQEVYISNNLPYIERLNEGWSAQAPAGFIERAVQYGLQRIRGRKVTE